MSEAPLSAWDPAGPDTPHPDVKVAGIALAEQPREELPARPLAVVPDLQGHPGPGRIFAGGAITLMVVVILASVFAVATADEGEGDGKGLAEQAENVLIQPNPSATPTDVKVDRKLDAKLRKERARKAAENDKAPKLRVKTAPTPSTPEEGDEAAGDPGPPTKPGTAQAIAKQMMPDYGFDPKSQFGCLYNLWMRESGWRTTAGRVNGPYGIPQANPGTKMAAYGPKWRTDAATQIKFGLSYIKGRYKTPCGAWSHFQSVHWY
ncbi:hypothetical protein GCM10027589_31360 [Actinocorallia lasiicapitis]